MSTVRASKSSKPARPGTAVRGGSRGALGVGSAVLFTLVLDLATVPAFAQPADPPAAFRAEVAKLVMRLESGDDALRAKAKERLGELGTAALEELRARQRGSPARDEIGEIIEWIEAKAALDRSEEARGREVVAAAGDLALVRANWPTFVARYLEDKLARAAELGRAGRHDEAIAVIDAARTLEPSMDPALATRFDALRRELKADRFARHTAGGEIELAKSVFVWGEGVTLAFKVVNTGGAELVLRGAGEVVRDGKRVAATSVIAARYVLRDWSMTGEVVTGERSFEIPITDDARLARGAAWTRPWTLALPPRPGPDCLYREVVLSARALPFAMVAGATALDQLSIAFPEQRLRVFPEGYEQHAAQPLRSLESALALRQRDVLFVATLLVPPHRHAEAIDRLTDGLEERPAPLARTSVALLERLTGQRFERLDQWRLWWLAHRERFAPREGW